MAVTAADTFYARKSADDGWSRQFSLEVPLHDPDRWMPWLLTLETALNFLSGDEWALQLSEGGPLPPEPQTRGRLVSLDGHDCAALFSGGLDSTIGALDLLAAGRRPVLISHSYQGDASRQQDIWSNLPIKPSRFAAIAHPISKLNEHRDVQMRTRSFNFLAYGILVCATMVQSGIVTGPAELHVPENGLIALNPPLTNRRIGSLSTRTTHPHFLSLIQKIVDGLGLPVRIVVAPYDLMTKGEMISGCADASTLASIVGQTVSCGKWKRRGIQCGRCVPCLIRRASLHSAGYQDNTIYEEAGQDLQALAQNSRPNDDLLAMMIAVGSIQVRDLRTWISQTGPLPTDRLERDAKIDVARRGLTEVSAYFEHLGIVC